MPILKEELSGCNWDFTAQDSRKVLDKSIESATKDSKSSFIVTSVEIGQDRGCLKLLDTMRVFGVSHGFHVDSSHEYLLLQFQFEWKVLSLRLFQWLHCHL